MSSIRIWILSTGRSEFEKRFTLYTISGLIDEIREGDRSLRFDLQERKQGLNAVYVKVSQYITVKF